MQQAVLLHAGLMGVSVLSSRVDVEFNVAGLFPLSGENYERISQPLTCAAVAAAI